MSIELKVADSEDVTLPARILESNLTLEEIGALFVLASLESAASDQAIQHAIGIRMGDAKFKEICVRFKDRGLLAMSITGKKVTIGLDIDSLESKA